MQQKREKIEPKDVATAQLHEKWSRLPASLVAHAASWIGDARSLAALESACQAWSAAANAKLNILWKALYLYEWEAISANDPSVAIDGAETSWKKRFAARTRIDRNWATGKYRRSMIEVDLSAPDGPMLAIVNSPPLLLCATFDIPVTVFSLPECKELRQLGTIHSSETLNVDESQSPPLAALCNEQTASVWNVEAAAQVGKTISFSSACIAVASYGNRLAALLANNTFGMFDFQSGEQIFALSLPLECHRLHWSSDGQWLLADYFPRLAQHLLLIDTRPATPVVTSLQPSVGDYLVDKSPSLRGDVVVLSKTHASRRRPSDSAFSQICAYDSSAFVHLAGTMVDRHRVLLFSEDSTRVVLDFRNGTLRELPKSTAVAVASATSFRFAAALLEFDHDDEDEGDDEDFREETRGLLVLDFGV